jgi:hypothetical protein
MVSVGCHVLLFIDVSCRIKLVLSVPICGYSHGCFETDDNKLVASVLILVRNNVLQQKIEFIAHKWHHGDHFVTCINNNSDQLVAGDVKNLVTSILI